MTIDYSSIDNGLLEVIELFNKVPGIKTIDSCLGHTGSGKECNHQTNVFIGVKKRSDSDIDKNLFENFFIAFFDKYPYKIDVNDGWVQFSLIKYLNLIITDGMEFVRFNIDVQHDPSIDLRGTKEKIDGLKLVCSFIRDYIEQNDDLSILLHIVYEN